MPKTLPMPKHKNPQTKSSNRSAKRMNLCETNNVYKSVWEVADTLEAMRPLMADSIYKDGWDDCLHLLKRGLRKLEL